VIKGSPNKNYPSKAHLPNASKDDTIQVGIHGTICPVTILAPFVTQSWLGLPQVNTSNSRLLASSHELCRSQW